MTPPMVFTLIKAGHITASSLPGNVKTRRKYRYESGEFKATSTFQVTYP